MEWRISGTTRYDGSVLHGDEVMGAEPRLGVGTVTINSGFGANVHAPTIGKKVPIRAAVPVKGQSWPDEVMEGGE